MSTSTQRLPKNGADRQTHSHEIEPDVPPMESAKERERIKVLRHYAVLDTEPEQELDELAAMAAHICGTPIALISLVDADRQWFKSKFGISSSETPRNQSFCAHAIECPQEVFVVPDASHDERFRGNPLVTGEPGIRFYAGAPLLTADDTALGTICVIDRVPRALTPTQLWMLQTLARRVMRKLESRLVTSEISQSKVLRAGVHDLNLEELQALVCSNPARWALWLRLLSFLTRPILDRRFSFAYISGSFLSSPVQQDGVKVTLETADSFKSCGFTPLESYIHDGQERILQAYSIHLRFWIKDKPQDQTGCEFFLSPQHPLIELGKRGARVVCVNLRKPKIVEQLHAALDPFKNYSEL